MDDEIQRLQKEDAEIIKAMMILHDNLERLWKTALQADDMSLLQSPDKYRLEWNYRDLEQQHHEIQITLGNLRMKRKIQG